MERKISTDRLKIGMYVCTLDRPWLDTPFMIQGFVVKTEIDIQDLRRYCRYVYIDTGRGVAADEYLDARDWISANDGPARAPLDVPRNDGVYEDTVSTDKELPTANGVLKRIDEFCQRLFSQDHEYDAIDIGAVREVVGPLVDSVIRNPDAVLWLSRLKQKHMDSYSHAVACCAVATAFGRHLNLPREELEVIAMATLLLDVGKVRLPHSLLQKSERLSRREFVQIQRHVEFSVDLVKKIQGIPSRVLDIVWSHHERHDGSGYPNGLKGEEIPVYGRIASIVDCYVAMTSWRPHRDAMSVYQVIHMLYAWRDVYFQHEAVEQFIQCLGVYPTGSLVELSTGEVAVVLAQNRTRSLRPKVMVVMGADQQPYNDYEIIDLMTRIEDRRGDRLEVVKGLDPVAYGIDPGDYYL